MQITPSIFLSSRLASPTSMYRLTLYLPAADTQSQLARPVPRQVLVLYSLGSDASSLWLTLIRRGMNAELANRNWNSTS